MHQLAAGLQLRSRSSGVGGARRVVLYGVSRGKRESLHDHAEQPLVGTAGEEEEEEEEEEIETDEPAGSGGNPFALLEVEDEGSDDDEDEGSDDDEDEGSDDGNHLLGTLGLHILAHILVHLGREIPLLHLVCSKWCSLLDDPHFIRQAMDHSWPGIAESTNSPIADTFKQLCRSVPRWETLRHNGVKFAPAYHPQGLQITYSGRSIELTPLQEEAAVMWVSATMQDPALAADSVFACNFMSDWQLVLSATEAGRQVQHLEQCDFSMIMAALEKAPEPPKRSKEAREADEPFAIAQIDGVERRVMNFSMIPPGIFRGRGPHPLRGRIRTRVLPEHVTLNLDAMSPIPPIPDLGDGVEHTWGAVISNDSVPWLASWSDPVTGVTNYVHVEPLSWPARIK